MDSLFGMEIVKSLKDLKKGRANSWTKRPNENENETYTFSKTARNLLTNSASDLLHPLANRLE